MIIQQEQEDFELRDRLRKEAKDRNDQCIAHLEKKRRLTSGEKEVLAKARRVRAGWEQFHKSVAANAAGTLSKQAPPATPNKMVFDGPPERPNYAEEDKKRFTRWV